MIIAITQRDMRIAPMPFEFDALERSWYRFLSGHTLIPIPNMVHEFDYDRLEFDCLMITGGPDSIDRNMTENILFAYAVKRNKPIIGICHGAFAINDLTGGVNGRIENHWETDHVIYMEGKDYLVNSYHGQSIEKVNSFMIPLAHDEDGNIEAFCHAEKQIYGIVWHPERMNNPVVPTNVKRLLEL